MKNIKIILKISIIFGLLSQTNAFDLEKGSMHRDSKGFKQEQKLRIWDFEDWAVEKKISDFNSIVGYLEKANNAYVLSRSLHLGDISKSLKTYLGNWPLVRWEPEVHSTGFLEQQYFSEDVSVISNLPSDTNLDYQLSIEDEVGHLGCLANTPLRYGDIENDGLNELVLTLVHFWYKGDVIIFSPEYQRVVFSARYALQDAMIEEGNQTYQYRRDTEGLSHQQGYKVFSKIFVGNFDGNENSDIIVWRKRFTSRTKEEGTQGYKLDTQLWQHFERDLEAQTDSESGITGEYLLQETADATIQSWLSENELTWSKGFPSVSECEGEEGKLIPEMHDPLLNDPDVLQ